tara:strand:+ start:291 stop:668 length:378 start_codon:yes stop_codon:yes gene_type:complete
MSHYDEEREKDKGGRPPTVLNDEEIAQVEALGAVLSIEQIADYFGIAKTTFYAVMERQPEVSLRYKRGKAKAIGSVSKGLLQKAQNGDNAAAIFYLKTQAGWKETTHVQQETKEVKTFTDMYGDS